MDLDQWGWSPELQRAFESYAGHMTPARVVRQDRTGYLVRHPAGETFARLPAHLRDEVVAVGDWVALDLAEPPTIRALLPRRTKLARTAPGREAREQVMAANVDVLFIVVAADDMNRAKIERYLVMAESAGVRPVVVVNKADIATAGGPAPAGKTQVRTSASTGLGIADLRALIPPGTTAAFVGPSGVGKSSLVNALLGEEALATSEIRAKDGKGRHTTTARYLLALPEGGILLDTPGIRELAMWDAEEGVAAVFDDIEALAARCKFRDCAHETEPACAVRENVTPERLASWRKLQREAAAAARRADVAAERKAAREWAKMAKRTIAGKRERLRD